jgi:hypothetical protein
MAMHYLGLAWLARLDADLTAFANMMFSNCPFLFQKTA